MHVGQGTLVRLALASILLAGAAAAGCIRYYPAPLSADDTLAAYASRSLADDGLRAFLERCLSPEPLAWPPERWDLRLLTLAAFHYHPDLDVARAGWAAARAGVVTAGERPNPDLTGSAGRNASAPSGVTASIATIDLSFPVETAGKRGKRVAEARNRAEAARLRVAAAAWQVRGGVRRGLLDLYAARERRTLLEARQALAADIVRLLELQSSAGAVSPSEVMRARIDLETVRLALATETAAEASALAALAGAVGLPVEALAGARFAFDAPAELPAEPTEAEAGRRATLQRFDLLAALADYAASQNALQIEIAKQYPDLHLGPGYEYDQGDHKWSLLVSLTLPALNRNRGPIAEAEARRSESAARFVALQAAVIADVDRALAGYRSALETLRVAETLQVEIDDRERFTRSAHAAGEIGRLEADATRLEANGAARERLEAELRARAALGELESAVQASFSMPEALWEASR